MGAIINDPEVGKAKAYGFLTDLETRLTVGHPGPDAMRTDIRRIVGEAKAGSMASFLAQPENAYLYSYALPIIVQTLRNFGGMDDVSAREALLCEFYRNLKEYTRETPARRIRHPFGKMLGSVTPNQIYERWTGTDHEPLTQSCPDFALQSPFPHKVVFEGKYFEKGSEGFAQRELVLQIYQAFFYRALPYVPAKPKSGNSYSPPWDYDYACLLAYDASEGGTLKQAWENLPANVKRGFWDGGNVYVMIIRN